MSSRECRVWRGGEAIPAAVGAAFVVGVPLRLLLPAGARYTLVVVVLATVSVTAVLVMPRLITRPAGWIVRALAGLAVSSPAPALAMGGTRRVEIHTHGGHGTKTAARHEAGHRRMAKAMGWKVHSAEIFPDGSGVTRLDIPKTASVPELVAISASGGIAAGTWAGCGSDLDYMKADLKHLPANERGKAKREGYALARRTVGGWIFDGGVSTDAAAIYKNGRI